MRKSQWSMKCFLERGRQSFLQLFVLLHQLSNKSPSPYLPEFIEQETTAFQPLSFFTHGKSLPSFPLEQILNISICWEGGSIWECQLPKLQICWYNFHTPICEFNSDLFSSLYTRAAQPPSWWLTVSHTCISSLVTVRHTLPAASPTAIPGAFRAPGLSHSSGNDSGLYMMNGNTKKKKKLKCFQFLRESLQAR